MLIPTWHCPVATPQVPRPCTHGRKVLTIFPTFSTILATEWSNRCSSIAHCLGKAQTSLHMSSDRMRVPASLHTRSLGHAHVTTHLHACAQVSRSHRPAHQAMVGFLSHVCLAHLLMASFLSVLYHARSGNSVEVIFLGAIGHTHLAHSLRQVLPLICPPRQIFLHISRMGLKNHVQDNNSL